MKLGARARYTLRLMMGIGKRGSEGRPVPLADISRNSGISKRYLDQLTVALKNASLIRGQLGRGGGYTLQRPANQITVGEIIEAANGPVSIAECVRRPESCIHSDLCRCRMLWALVEQRINEVFNEFSLADLLDKRCAQRIRSELESCHHPRSEQ